MDIKNKIVYFEHKLQFYFKKKLTFNNKKAMIKMRCCYMNNNDFNICLGEDLQVVKPQYSGVQNWTCDYTPKPYGHLDFITSGNMEIRYEGKKYYAGANTILCIPKNKRYFFKVSGNFSYYSFFYEYTSNLPNHEFNLPLVFKTSNTKYFYDKYKTAYNLYLIKNWGYKIKIQELFFDVFSKLNEEYFNSLKSNGNYTIKKSVEHIHQNFSNPDLCLTDIASFSEISDTHFRRVFKSVYGTSPNKYINSLRINKAKSMLANSNLSIEEISYKCGYNDYSYFIKLFSRATGYTPLKYRKSFDNDIIY